MSRPESINFCVPEIRNASSARQEKNFQSKYYAGGGNKKRKGFCSMGQILMFEGCNYTEVIIEPRAEGAHEKIRYFDENS